ncbi:MAG: hypothetical protein ACXWQO_00425 [Bdellovibrionota bacterium]
MRYLLCLFLALNAQAAKPAVSPNPLIFVELKSYQQEAALPPKLLVTFDVDCGDEFVKLIREDIPDKKTGITKIAIGGIVQTNIQSACVGTYREITVAAGNTFSGKQFEVVKILKNPRSQKMLTKVNAK